MTHLSLRCPSCEAKLRAPLVLIGRMCSCPRCKYRVQVRPPTRSDAEVALVLEDDGGRQPASPARRR